MRGGGGGTGGGRGGGEAGGGGKCEGREGTREDVKGTVDIGT